MHSLFLFTMTSPLSGRKGLAMSTSRFHHECDIQLSVISHRRGQSSAPTLGRQNPGPTLGRNLPAPTLGRQNPGPTLGRNLPAPTLGRKRHPHGSPRSSIPARGRVMASPVHWFPAPEGQGVLLGAPVTCDYVRLAA
jgi:hypothetical protein